MEVLPSAYFPSLEYTRVLLTAQRIVLDYHENFIKQSIRSRCHILSANGVLKLNVPIIHNGKQATSKVAIDYSKNWQTEHLRAISSAYAKAPYFEYYFYDIAKLLELSPKYLTQLNESILLWLDRALDLKSNFQKASNYTGQIELDKKHWLNSSSNPTLTYTQTFGEENEFVTNLSVIDGLMNEGPLIRNHFLPR